MKNKEIEEILNKMKNCNGVFDYYLEYGEVGLLLSYIEQLEKEIEKLKQQDKNKDTRNSRQRVSNAYQIIQNDKLKRCFNTQKRRRKEEAQKKRLYKSRIDKAIEYTDTTIEIIEQQPTGNDAWILDRLKGFKNVLKGDSDE